MGYLGSTARNRGDYLGGRRGDPGLFGFLGKVAKGALGVVGKLGIPGISGAAGLASGFIGGRQYPVSRAAPGPAGFGQMPVPGLRGFGQRLVPGGATGYMTPRRRRMNVGNVKALRRAMRRQEGFVRLARRALKGSKYTITTRGASRAPRHIHVKESGPGGVTVGR